jgi:hypothetical protein
MSTENFFVSYDLNGQHPTRKEMDDHLKKLGRCTLQILSPNDRLLVIEAVNSSSGNLLVPIEALRVVGNRSLSSVGRVFNL